MFKWIAELFGKLEDKLIDVVMSRLHDKEKGTEGSVSPLQWAITKRNQSREVQKEIQEELKKTIPSIRVNISTTLEAAFEGAAEEATLGIPLDSDTPYIHEIRDKASETSINRHKLNKIIEETNSGIDNATQSIFRTTNDEYRRTTEKAAQLMEEEGLSLNGAIDTATKDFLSKGISGIIYRDGSRMNIQSYAEMAIRTASKRAQLYGGAAKRDAMGIDTVLISQYGACSDTCLPWQGKVYIDDVFGSWSGEHSSTRGLSNDGTWYTLLSVAMDKGLFHPNCRHSAMTWIKGITERPAPLDAKEVAETANKESLQRRLERETRRERRILRHTTNKQDRTRAANNIERLQNRLERLVKESDGKLRRHKERE